MNPPRSISKDAPTSKRGVTSSGDAAVHSISQHATVALTEAFDDRSAVMYRIVAVPRTAGGDCEHAAVAAANQHLRVA
jgi:hypothetical protein